MPEQLILPFGHRFAEDRAALVRAIRIAGLKSAEETFLLYVHDVSRDTELRRTYHEIAERINCARRTAIRLVQRCVDSGILIAVVDRYRSGGQRENAYSIDWDAVRQWVFGTVTPPTRSGVSGVTRGCHFVTGECHGDTGECQTVTPYKEIDPLIDPPIDPPPPQKRRGGGGFSYSEDWGAIKARLESLGMLDSVGAIKAARESQLATSDVIAIIDEWESSRPAWDVGGLYWRLSRGNWPEKSAESVDQVRRTADDRRRAEQRDELAAIRREADKEAARARELEQRCGPLLDSLTPDELEHLVGRVYPDAWQIAYYHRDRASPLVRIDLLMELERSLQEVAT